MLLRRDGYEVFEARDGDDAIELVKNHAMDLVLLDLHMPDARVNGFGVLHYLQEHHRSLPVVLLTGIDPRELQRGMHGQHLTALPLMLLKPVDPQQVLDVVAAELGLDLPTATDTPTAPDRTSPP
jgi:CheY-like chemotaxis protein